MDFQNNACSAVFASYIVNNIHIPTAITGNITSTGGTNGSVVFMGNRYG